MEVFLDVLSSMNIAEIIVFILVAIYLIKQPLEKRLDSQDKRFDSQDKRFDDLRDLFKSELSNINKRLDDQRDLFNAKIKPIETALNNHITDTTKEIKALNEKLDKLISLKEK